MPYPKNCIRGILRADFVIKDQDRRYATAELYQFRNSDREDGMHEASINWDDDKKAIEFTFNQKNNDETFKYEGGIAILQRRVLDKIKKVYGPMQFNYVRARSPDNKYHGNLLLNLTNRTSRISKMIRSVLAHHSEIHFRHEYSDLQPTGCLSNLASLFKSIASKVFLKKPKAF